MSLREMESGLRRLWVSLECCSVGVWPPPDPRPCPRRKAAGWRAQQTDLCRWPSDGAHSVHREDFGGETGVARSCARGSP